MDDSIKIDGSEYISSSRAAKLAKYSSDYIGQLCRRGSIPGRLVGRTWYVNKECLLEHKIEHRNRYNEERISRLKGMICRSSHSTGKVVVHNEAPMPTKYPPTQVKWEMKYEQDLRPLLPLLKKNVQDAVRMTTPRPEYANGHRVGDIISGIKMRALARIVGYAFILTVGVSGAWTALDSKTITFGQSASVSESRMDRILDEAAQIFVSGRDWLATSLSNLLGIGGGSLASDEDAETMSGVGVVQVPAPYPQADGYMLAFDSNVERAAQQVIINNTYGTSTTIYMQDGASLEYVNNRFDVINSALADLRSLRTRQTDSIYDDLSASSASSASTLSYSNITGLPTTLSGYGITDLDSSVNAYIGASTTMAKLYADNTWTGLQAFMNTGTTTFAGGLEATYIDLIGATATSTFAKGIDIADGCFAVDGVCITGGGASLSGGIPDAFAYWTSGSTLGATTSPAFGYVTATLSNATSTFAGGLQVGGSSGLYVLNNGRVGVGTMNPQSALDVIGTASSTRYLANNGSNSAPSYSFDSMPNTGLYNTSGNVSVSITGTQRAEFYENGLILYANGSTDQAALSIGSDLGLGLYAPAASNLGFLTNSTEKMRIDPAGNVGIGTTSPSQELSITGDIYATGDFLSGVNAPIDTGSGLIISKDSSGNLVGGTFRNTNSAGYEGFNFYNDVGALVSSLGHGNSSVGATAVQSSTFLGSRNAEPVHIVTNGLNPRLTVTPAGNVGVGTSSPLARLQSSASSFTNTVTPLGSIGSTHAALYLTNTDNRYGLVAGVLGTGPTWLQAQRTDGTATAYNLLLNPLGGNVGIGTSSPEAKLNVYGGAIFQGTQGNNKLSIISTGNNNRPVFYMGPESDTDEFRILNNGIWQMGSTAAVDLELITSGITRMRLLSTGNVGIGTTSPYAKLSVVGPVVAEYFHATSTTATSSFMGVVGIGTTTPLSTLYVDGSFMAKGGSGDVNGSGSIDVSDTVTLSQYLLGMTGLNIEQLAKSDVNGDGRADYTDVMLIRQKVLGFNFDDSSRRKYSDMFSAISYNSGTWSNGQWTNKLFIADSRLQVGTTSPLLTDQAIIGIGDWATEKNTDFGTLKIVNSATSTSAGITKKGVEIQSYGSWAGANSMNIGLYVSNVSGAVNNYDAIFNGGGNVGIGTTTPWRTLSVTGSSDLGNNALAGSFTATSTATSTFNGGITVAGGNIALGSVDASSGLWLRNDGSNSVLSSDDDIYVGYQGGSTKSTIFGSIFASPTMTVGNARSATGAVTIQGSSGITYLGRDSTQAPYYSNMLLAATGVNQDVSIALESARLSTTQRWFFGSGSGATPNTNNFRIVDLTDSSTDAFNIQPGTQNIGIGTTSPVSKLTVVGSGCFSTGPGATVACGTTDGVIYYTSASTGNYDVAETYQISDPSIEPGDIVALDPMAPLRLIKATPGSHVMGVISTDPGLNLGGADASILETDSRPVALSGRVPVKVSLEGGPIAIGDRIAYSTSPGIGRKAQNGEETIGMALSSFAGEQTGTIEVFINLRKEIDLSQYALASSISTSTLSVSPSDSDQKMQELIAAIQVLSARVDMLEAASSTVDLANPDLMVKLASDTADALASSTPSFISRVAGAVIEHIQGVASWTFTKVTSALAIFDRVEMQTASVAKGLEMTDQATGQVYCVRIENGEWSKTAGACVGATVAQTEISPTPAPTSSPLPSATASVPAAALTDPVVVDTQASSTISATLASSTDAVSVPATATSTTASGDEGGNTEPMSTAGSNPAETVVTQISGETITAPSESVTPEQMPAGETTEETESRLASGEISPSVTVQSEPVASEPVSDVESTQPAL